MSKLLERLAQGKRRSALCPDCDELLSPDAMNIREGVALCPACGTLSKLSELNTSGRSNAELLANPASGCAVDWDERQVAVTCALRSLGGFAGVAVFALFWNGIISVFALQAMAGLYANLIGPLPGWFPALGVKDGVPEMNDAPMDLGMTLFLCIFLLPFLVIGIGTMLVALTMLFGKTVAVIDEFDSYIATGIGRFRWKRRFDPRKAQSVKIVSAAWQSENSHQMRIVLVADKTIRFASMLNEDQRAWFRAQLDQLLFAPDRASNGIVHQNLQWLHRDSR